MPVVVKVFHPHSSKTAFATEQQALQQINENKEFLPLHCRVTSLLGVALEDGRQVLLLEPEGKPFACSSTEQQSAAAGNNPLKSQPQKKQCLTSSTHFCLLVDILHFLHTRPKLAHRDVKLSNFFALDDNSILLGDFGSSAPLGARVQFCGSLQNAPLECVAAWNAGAFYEVKASHDLEMVVRAIFQRVSPQLYAVIQGSRDANYLTRFWQTHTSGQLWENTLFV